MGLSWASDLAPGFSISATMALRTLGGQEPPRKSRQAGEAYPKGEGADSKLGRRGRPQEEEGLEKLGG